VGKTCSFDSDDETMETKRFVDASDVSKVCSNNFHDETLGEAPSA
jgi:hypothetical protein